MLAGLGEVQECPPRQTAQQWASRRQPRESLVVFHRPLAARDDVFTPPTSSPPVFAAADGAYNGYNGSDSAHDGGGSSVTASSDAQCHESWAGEQDDADDDEVRLREVLSRSGFGFTVSVVNKYALRVLSDATDAVENTDGTRCPVDPTPAQVVWIAALLTSTLSANLDAGESFSEASTHRVSYLLARVVAVGLFLGSVVDHLNCVDLCASLEGRLDAGAVAARDAARFLSSPDYHLFSGDKIPSILHLQFGRGLVADPRLIGSATLIQSAVTSAYFDSFVKFHPAVLVDGDTPHNWDGETMGLLSVVPSAFRAIQAVGTFLIETWGGLDERFMPPFAVWPVAVASYHSLHKVSWAVEAMQEQWDAMQEQWDASTLHEQLLMPASFTHGGNAILAMALTGDSSHNLDTFDSPHYSMLTDSEIHMLCERLYYPWTRDELGDSVNDTTMKAFFFEEVYVRKVSMKKLLVDTHWNNVEYNKYFFMAMIQSMVMSTLMFEPRQEAALLLSALFGIGAIDNQCTDIFPFVAYRANAIRDCPVDGYGDIAISSPTENVPHLFKSLRLRRDVRLSPFFKDLLQQTVDWLEDYPVDNMDDGVAMVEWLKQL